MPDSPAELTFSAPARPECLDRIHDLLAQLWQQHPEVSEGDRIMFTTAVLEVGNNILTHGTPITISVVVTADAGQLEAGLTDDGAAAPVNLKPAVLPGDLAESGRGLAIVQMAVDEVTHHYANGRNHWHLLRQCRSGTS